MLPWTWVWSQGRGGGLRVCRTAVAARALRAPSTTQAFSIQLTTVVFTVAPPCSPMDDFSPCFPGLPGEPLLMGCGEPVLKKGARCHGQLLGKDVYKPLSRLWNFSKSLIGDFAIGGLQMGCQGTVLPNDQALKTR